MVNLNVSMVSYQGDTSIIFSASPSIYVWILRIYFSYQIRI